MTIPEYDEECDCEFCKEEREKRKMTSSSEQPKEYIITEEQLHNLVHGNAQLCLVMEKEVRSRPHQAPARSEKCCKGCEADMCAEACQTWINEHDAATARQAREDVLEPLIEWLSQKRRNYGACGNRSANDDPEDCDPYDTVLRKVNSLRQQAGDHHE